MLTAPPPHPRDEWIALKHLAVHWAPHLEGIAGKALATELLLAVARGEVPIPSTQIVDGDGVPHSLVEVGGLGEFIDKTVDQGFSKLKVLDDLLEERGIALRIDRAGTLLFAELYGYPPPPWWAPLASTLGNEGQRRSAGTWQRESCEAAFAALFPGGIPNRAAMTNQKLLAEVESYLKGSGRRVPSDDTILREAGRKPRRRGK